MTKNYVTENKEISNVNDLDVIYGKYSYADYFSWKIKERIELIKGKIFQMSPGPSMMHQNTSMHLSRIFYNFLDNKKCKVFSAPFDVRFPDNSIEDKDIGNVVQPDISVVCDLSKLDSRGCLGTPGLIVEILSRSSSKRDLKYKFELYENHGVKEYWVVHPEEHTLLIYTLDKEGKYQPSHLKTRGDKIRSSVLVGFELNLDHIFEYIEPKPNLRERRI